MFWFWLSKSQTACRRWSAEAGRGAEYRRMSEALQVHVSALGPDPWICRFCTFFCNTAMVGVSINGDTPKRMVYSGKYYVNSWLGSPLILGNLCIYIYIDKDRSIYIYHTHTHTYIHTYIYIYTYILTYIHAYIHTYMHTCIHTCIHTYIHTCIHTYIHTCIHTYMHTCIHAYIHA